MHDNDHMIKSLRRELDKVKNAMKGKTTMNLDGILKRTDSPFTFATEILFAAVGVL